MRVSLRNSSGRSRLMSLHGSVIAPGCPGGNSATLLMHASASRVSTRNDLSPAYTSSGLYFASHRFSHCSYSCSSFVKTGTAVSTCIASIGARFDPAEVDVDGRELRRVPLA